MMDKDELKELVAHSKQIGARGVGREVGFTSPHMVSSILPYRSTEDKVREVVKGRRSIILTGARHGLPYGRYARLIFAYITTQATHNAAREEMSDEDKRRIDFGDTFNEFMRKIGVANSGASTKKIVEQVQRIASVTIEAWETDIKDGVSYEQMASGAKLANRVEFWHTSSQPDMPSLLGGSYIQLTSEFFDMVTSRPVPFDFATLTALRSPLAMDMYLWATYQTSFQREAFYTASFPEMAEMMGLSKASKNNKQAIVRAVEQVREAWGEDCPLYVMVDEDRPGDSCVILAAGAPHISRREGEAQLGS